MSFWDASAIVPLLVEEAGTSRSLSILEQQVAIVVWWGTTVECWSAAARLRREGQLSNAEERDVNDRLKAMREDWTEIHPTEAIRETARRLLRVHPLRAADALQLAAALAWVNDPTNAGMVTYDLRLAEAAAAEGFTVHGAGHG